MRVFLAGATGAVGKRLIPLLRDAGLAVVGTTRSPEKAEHLRTLGVQAEVADAAVAALQRGTPGIYNVADDEPAPVSEWLPFLANAIAAPPPRRVPSWLGRLLVGQHGVVLMNETRGCSNAKAKAAFDWRLTMRAGGRALSRVSESSE